MSPVERASEDACGSLWKTALGFSKARAVVIGLVSGTFPGTPIRLRYIFRLSEGTIARLEIK